MKNIEKLEKLRARLDIIDQDLKHLHSERLKVVTGITDISNSMKYYDELSRKFYALYGTDGLEIMRKKLMIYMHIFKPNGTGVNLYLQTFGFDVDIFEMLSDDTNVMLFVSELGAQNIHAVTDLKSDGARARNILKHQSKKLGKPKLLNILKQYRIKP